MKEYWPSAEYLTEDGRIEKTSTYDYMDTLGTARQQIELWKSWYHFNVQKAWIDVYENGTRQETININPKDGSVIGG